MLFGVGVLVPILLGWMIRMLTRFYREIQLDCDCIMLSVLDRPRTFFEIIEYYVWKHPNDHPAEIGLMFFFMFPKFVKSGILIKQIRSGPDGGVPEFTISSEYLETASRRAREKSVTSAAIA